MLPDNAGFLSLLAWAKLIWLTNSLTFFYSLFLQMNEAKRKQNEKEFDHWETTKEGRLYWIEVIGRNGGKARYVKEVDANEITLAFWQEIFDKDGNMIEMHEKYPIDKGHKKI
jgi:hypothetical protein